MNTQEQLANTLRQIKILREAVTQQLDLLAEMQINIELSLDKTVKVDYDYTKQWVCL